ncbi:hypothetical protein C8R43DRAFT_1049880, partial [Mycena crocata]
LIDLCLHLRRLSPPSSPLPPLIAIVAATAIGVSASPRRRRRCLLSPSHLPLIAVAATFCSSLLPVAAIAANTTATSQALHRVPVWLLFKKDIKSPPYAACDIFFLFFRSIRLHVITAYFSCTSLARPTRDFILHAAYS